MLAETIGKLNTMAVASRGLAMGSAELSKIPNVILYTTSENRTITNF